MPDKIIWNYTLPQIYKLYNLILQREVAEKNELVKIIQAGYSGLKEDFISIKSDKGETKNLGEIGMQAESYYKNYNPNLTVKEGE